MVKRVQKKFGKLVNLNFFFLHLIRQIKLMLVKVKVFLIVPRYALTDLKINIIISKKQNKIEMQAKATYQACKKSKLK